MKVRPGCSYSHWANSPAALAHGRWQSQLGLCLGGPAERRVLEEKGLPPSRADVPALIPTTDRLELRRIINVGGIGNASVTAPHLVRDHLQPAYSTWSHRAAVKENSTGARVGNWPL